MLIATAAVPGRGPRKARSGVFLVDMAGREVRQVFDSDAPGMTARGLAGCRLGGIAFHGETVFIAAGDELFAFDPDFGLQGAWKNPYLRGCEEICVFDGQVFLASADFDSVLAFDIGNQRFHWGMCLEPEEYRFRTRIFDPRSDDGPLMLDRMHLNSVVANRDGLYLAGLGSGGMLHFNGRQVSMSASLPAGALNAQPYRDGVLFIDTGADALRFASPDSDRERVMRPPPLPRDQLHARGVDVSRVARPSCGRGLCVAGEGLVAAGIVPSTVALYDLASGQAVLTVMFSADGRNAVHGLARWPFERPASETEPVSQPLR